MKNFYSTVVLENNMFYGIVYNSANNEELYKTQGYTSQVLAMNDTNNFIKRGLKNISESNAIPPNNNSQSPQIHSTPRRCCGR